MSHHAKTLQAMHSQVTPHPEDATRVLHYVCRPRSRYYRLWVQQDLFGVWCLVRVWGGLGTARGQLRSEPQPDAETGEAALKRAHQRRLQRHYELCSASEGP
jgi:predicted DNA-binding WGR domain protein